MTKEQKAAKEAEEQHQRTLDNLKENAAKQHEAAKAQKEARIGVEKAMDILISNTPSIHKQKIANAVYQAKKLLKELDNGGNQAEIIKKLNAIK